MIVTVPAQELSTLVLLDKNYGRGVESKIAKGVAAGSTVKVEQVQCQGGVVHRPRVTTKNKQRSRDPSASPQVEEPDVEIGKVDVEAVQFHCLCPGGSFRGPVPWAR